LLLFVDTLLVYTAVTSTEIKMVSGGGRRFRMYFREHVVGIFDIGRTWMIDWKWWSRKAEFLSVGERLLETMGLLASPGL